MLLSSYHFNVFPVNIAIAYSLFQSCIKTYLINKTQASGTNLKTDPALLFYIIEFLAEQVYVKAALCAML
jgi:hypothetical protein